MTRLRMDALRRPTTRPGRLARELADRLARLREAVAAEPNAAHAMLERLLTPIDAGRPSSLRRRIADDPLARAEVAVQLFAFRSLVRCLDADEGHNGGCEEAAEADFAAIPAARELAAALQGHDLAQMLAEVGGGRRAIDPLGQFHELLLQQCDARLRRRRGVFYTPGPIVRWMVRSAAWLLRSRLQTAQGVRLIDPACGSGAFLAGALEGLRESRFPPGTPVSLVGFDVLPATCAVARMLLARQAAASLDAACPQFRHLSRQARGEEQPPLRVECFNPLIEGEALAPLVLGAEGELPLILGNPPYANFGRQNRGTWIARLLQDYKAGLDERKLNLDDDFIKFFRWSQYWIERAGRGMLALLTSRTYLDGLTHRAMRAGLGAAFDEIFVLDLGGDVDKLQGAASRAADENVFGIRRGVAIGMFVKTGAGGGPARVRYHALRGTREEKFSALEAADFESIPWRAVSLSAPEHCFVPRARRNSEYRSWPRLDEIFTRYVSGVQTKHDALWTDLSRDRLECRMRALLDGGAPRVGDGQDAALEPIRILGDNQNPRGGTRQSSENALDFGSLGDFRYEFSDRLLVEQARAKLSRPTAGIGFRSERIRPYLTAPLDRRWIYYEPRLLGRARWPTMRHMLRPNVGLVFMRQSTCEGEYDHFLATGALASDRAFYSTHGAPFVAPLWLYDDDEADGRAPAAPRRPNLEPSFAADFAARLKLRYAVSTGRGSERAGDAPDGGRPNDALRPEDVFHYAYAVFFDREYRRRYGDELRVDFPRLPVIDDAARFRRLCECGRRLCELHLRGPRGLRLPPDAHIGAWHIDAGYPRFVSATAANHGSPQTLVVAPGERSGVLLNRRLLLAGIPANIWSYRLGGCDVLPRWLRRRRGSELSLQQRKCLLELIETIAQTIRLSDSVSQAPL